MDRLDSIFILILCAIAMNMITTTKINKHINERFDKLEQKLLKEIKWKELQ